MRPVATSSAALYPTLLPRLVAGLIVGLLAGLAQAAEPVTTVIAVRHAEKAVRAGKDPDLTDAGRARAAALSALIKDGALVGGLYSSEWKRARETLVPLAERLDLEITVVPAAETNQQLTAEHFLSQHPGQIVIVSGHSNTIPSLVEALSGTPMPDLDDSMYDTLYIVSLHADGKAHALRLAYGAATP